MQIPIKFQNQLWEAFQSAFPTQENLAFLVQIGLEEKLQDITKPGTLPHLINQLITWATAQGKFETLLVAAREENPGNPDLASAAERFFAWKESQEGAGGVSVAEEIRDVALAPPPGSVGSYTNNTVWPPYVSPQGVHNWALAMEKAARCICRIETLEGSKSFGTGFLIGPRLILTAEYVLSDKNVELRFDYGYEEDGITPNQGTVYKLADHWLIDRRKNHYSLILAEGSPGTDLVNGTNQQRGWVHVSPDYQAQSGEPLFIMGHYDSKPLSLGHFFVMLDAQEKSPFLTYGAYHNLRSLGLGGAPIFNANLEAIGLHSMLIRPLAGRKYISEAQIRQYMIIPPEEDEKPLLAEIKRHAGVHANMRVGITLQSILTQPAVQLALAVSGH